jgi:hypothetical protein
MVLGLDLDFDLGLGIPLLLDAARHGAVWECGLCRRFALRGNPPEKFSRLISVPVHRSDLSMAKSRPPHSGDSRTSRVAARKASAFNLESQSSLHVFHTTRPWVTFVSIPLVLTRTSPAVANLDVRAAGMFALLNIALPMGFLAPLLPSQLWKSVHAEIAVALTTCWFSDKYFAASSRSTMVMWSSLLRTVPRRSWPPGPVPASPGPRPLTRAALALPRPGGNGLPCLSVTHSRAAVAVGHVGSVVRVVPRSRHRILPPSPGSGGMAEL